MLHNYPFKNYAEFKELFGTPANRKNKILFAYYASPYFKSIFKKYGRRLADAAFPHDLAELKSYVKKLVAWETRNFSNRFNFCGWDFRMESYKLDVRNGICEDGDVKCVRVYSLESHKIVKVRGGKLFAKVFDEHDMLRSLPEQVKVWVCEEFAAEWSDYAKERMPESGTYTLHVDDDFEGIYNSRRTIGCFNSCMTDRDRHSFYENAVDASAAYLTNADDKIVARCIIFNEVHDEDGNVYRYAERQYATEDEFKRILINKLIAEDKIDIYKVVGAGCGDSRSIVDKNGESMSRKDFRINCDLNEDDVLSYQDTFKWYDIRRRVAYNNDGHTYDYGLDTTEEHLEGSNWDEWHEEYTTSDLVTVYCNGTAYECSEDRLDDFRWIARYDEYHHYDDCYYCEQCGEYYLDDDGAYSEITEEYYCCQGCLDEAEREYKRNHWTWSDWEDDYVDPDTCVRFYNVEEDFEEDFMSEESWDDLSARNRIIECGEKWFFIGELSSSEAFKLAFEFAAELQNA